MSYRKRRNKLRRHDRHDEHDPGVAHEAKTRRLEDEHTKSRRVALRDQRQGTDRRIAAGKQPNYRGLTPDQLPTSGPGIDRRCDPAGTCPKRQNPDAYSWQSGCWCYRQAGGPS